MVLRGTEQKGARGIIRDRHVISGGLEERRRAIQLASERHGVVT